MNTIKAFHSLSLTEKRSVAATLSIIQCEQNETIICRTDKSKDVYFLLSGQVRVSTFSPNGKEIQFEDLEAGEMFGELAAIDGGERTGDCISRTQSTIAVMSRPDFQRAIERFPGLNHYLINRLAEIIRNQMFRVVEISAHTVKDRLRHELVRLADRQGKAHDNAVEISDAPTHADFASRIGTHREAVTRELSSLHKQGLITWTRTEHQINDLDSLRRSIGRSHDPKDSE